MSNKLEGLEGKVPSQPKEDEIEKFKAFREGLFRNNDDENLRMNCLIEAVKIYSLEITDHANKSYIDIARDMYIFVKNQKEENPTQKG